MPFHSSAIACGLIMTADYHALSYAWRRTMTVSRREFLQTGAMTMTMMGASASAGTQTAAGGPPPVVKALVFDTFGTVVDWRSSVAREVAAVAKRKGVALDAAKFADAWRA